MTEERHHLVVDLESAGSRIDAFLAAHTPLSRTRIAALVREGGVTLNGERPRKAEVVQEGDRIEVELPEPKTSAIEAEDIPLDILYEDPHLLVVNKPAGMVVHPAPGHRSGTLVNALLYHVKDLSGIGGTLRPGIVHRLDRDTSGLLVVAKEDSTHQALSLDLRERKIRRLYLAAAWGHLPEAHMRIDAPIGRDPRNRLRMAVNEGGRRAVTRVRVRERWRSAELLDVALETGRTHQIRVHLAHIGHPVVGDALYGVGWERGMGSQDHGWAKALVRRTPRHFLHAARLSFEHPVTRETMTFRADLPADIGDAARWAAGEGTVAGEPDRREER